MLTYTLISFSISFMPITHSHTFYFHRWLYTIGVRA